ncbi:flagellar hook-associated protein FlgL [Propionispora hippei]|uniref:Flagellar hook-associated protein 3 FlgL n=1 Tax=Propionispora hippei DSM 15287 TaxID=1123003 RepID=A0A1M6C1C5_9FIRM|nr:flagellar hook-associated protein FlgL [Propionispora hippei]SHI54800.1 flagellar hook-associated protein 3 FlgL [Propionispora hippei DSM 15287]
MRITNNMIVANTIKNLNNSASRMNEAEERISTEKKISLPSDDPVIATRAIKYRSYVDTVEQYQKNTDDVTSWQSTTDGALSDLSDIMGQVRTLVVKASSDTLSDSDKSAIKEQISELQKNAIDVMNTSYGGRYIFGGYSTGDAPYALKSTSLTDSSGDSIDVNLVTFKGKYVSLEGIDSSATDSSIESAISASNVYSTSSAQPIKVNVGFDTDVTVNVEGQDVVGGADSNLFNTFNKILLALNGNTSYKTATVDTSTSPATTTVSTSSISDMSDLLTDVDADITRISTAQSTLGASMKNVSMISDRLDNAYTTYTTLMSNNEDVDISKATIESSSAEAVYNAALAVGAKAISKTLVDYLA